MTKTKLIIGVVLVIFGLLVFIAALIFPFPTEFPGAIWRIVIAVFGCFFAALGAYTMTYAKNK